MLGLRNMRLSPASMSCVCNHTQPMPETVLFKYLVEIVLGLFVLHANRILHRDIKPANVFVGANDTIKLGDLGVAKLLSGEAQAKTSIGTPNVRRTPHACGTSPRQRTCQSLQTSSAVCFRKFMQCIPSSRLRQSFAAYWYRGSVALT